MSSDNKKVTLVSSDIEAFEVDVAVAKQSAFLTHLIEDCGADKPIPVPNVTSPILIKVIEYCKKHAYHTKPVDDKFVMPEYDIDDETEKTDHELNTWDANFINVDQKTLFGIIMAANFLNIKSLLDLGTQTVANMMKGRTPEEIRKTFHIKNDFTPAAEEKIRRVFKWAFDVFDSPSSSKKK